jgi:hypothetical protein
MQKLKCSDGGGTLKVAMTDDGIALSTCAHCGAEYLLDRQRKQYVFVENRFARLRTHNQKITVAARAMAERKTFGLRS